MRACRIFGAAVLGALALAQCTGRNDGGVAVQTRAMSEACEAARVEQPATPADDAANRELTPVTSCAEVVPAITRQALREMNATLDRNLREALAIHCQPCQNQPTYDYGSDHGDGSHSVGCGSSLSSASYQDAGASWVDGAAHSSADAGTANGDDSADQYSTTNNQVAGVDEPDFLKNDGAYIYIVANGYFRIVDAWPPEEARTLAAVKLEGTPTGLFVYADRAVVYSVLGTTTPPCTYAYGCQVTGTGGPFLMTVWDIADRANPVRLRRIESNGSLVSSRRMGNIVHTVSVVGHDGYGLQAAWSDWPQSVARYTPYCDDTYQRVLTPAQVKTAFAALRARNTAAIERHVAASFGSKSVPQPKLIDERYDGPEPVRDETLLRDCRGFYVAGSTDGLQVLTLTSFDLTVPGPLGVTSVVGSAGAIYANPTSLYVAQPIGDTGYYDWTWSWRWDWNGGWRWDWASRERTAIHKFRVSPERATTEYAGSGLVPGHVLNQFSMDERDGNLRVASGVGWIPDPTAHSVVSVLAEAEGRLAVVGELDQIAPGEDIRAARFDEDTVYLVTFRNTDPLFVIDLADPTRPTMQGQLVIAGFSTYMHPMDDTHVIGIGFQSDFGGWFQGLQLEIFDVSNPSSPRLTHYEAVDTWGVTSDAATNHLAFNYFAPKNLLAIPIALCTPGSYGYYGSRLSFDGLLVYRATAANGFQKLGGIPHADPAVADADGNGCYRWWTSPDAGVKRSIIMDDYVYAVALDVIKVSALADLAHPVASVDLVK